MKIAWLIRAAVVYGAIAVALTGDMALAQSAVATLPAPRLSFSADEMRLAGRVAGNPGLADFYGTNGLQPIFTGAEATARRAALIEAVGQAARHGLPQARYGHDLLVRLDQAPQDWLTAEIAFALAFARWSHDITGGILEPGKVESGIKRKVQRPSTGEMMRAFAAAPDPRAWLAALPSRDPRYLALQAALAREAGMTAAVDVAPVPEGSWREGMTDPAVGLLRARLRALGLDAPPLGDPTPFDPPLADAVARFQRQAGLADDGVAGPRTVARLNRGPGAESRSILVALERMRWMHGHDPLTRQVWVNLPEFTARILENGEERFATRVVIGKADPSYETPEFTEPMKYIVVNPRWNVPRSITVKEYLPRLQANRNAVRHLDVVDGRGNVIPRERIDFRRYTAANFPYRMRQKPSDDNALGVVKFMFPNPWNIYLHDTPTKHLFNESRRAYSHGCIRVGRPIDLAHALLEGQLSDPEAAVSKALGTGRETYLNIRGDLPVHLVYFTAFPDESGQIRRFPDIYGRDALVHAALIKAGIDSSLDSAAVGD